MDPAGAPGGEMTTRVMFPVPGAPVTPLMYLMADRQPQSPPRTGGTQSGRNEVGSSNPTETVNDPSSSPSDEMRSDSAGVTGTSPISSPPSPSHPEMDLTGGGPQKTRHLDSRKAPDRLWTPKVRAGISGLEDSAAPKITHPEQWFFDEEMAT